MIEVPERTASSACAQSEASRASIASLPQATRVGDVELAAT